MVFKKINRLLLLEQTLFTLPFAYIGILIAGPASISQWLYVTLALFAARTTGMAYNRIIDAKIDAANPRTKNREIPSGALSKSSVIILSIISSLLFTFASFKLNMLCFYLSLAANGLLFAYSYFKRFSSSAHFFLGFVEAAAPIGGYLAITGRFHLIAFVPGITIMFWIAGLDIMYAFQDLEFDKNSGLHSIPARLGVTSARLISIISYIIAIAAMTGIGFYIQAEFIYYIAILLIVGIMLAQQMLFNRNITDAMQVMPKIFFLNKFISFILFAGLLLNMYLPMLFSK